MGNSNCRYCGTKVKKINIKACKKCFTSFCNMGENSTIEENELKNTPNRGRRGTTN